MQSMNVKAFDLSDPTEVSQLLEFLLDGALKIVGTLGGGFTCYEHAPAFAEKMGWRTIRIDVTRLDQFNKAVEHVVLDIVKNEYKFFKKMQNPIVSNYCSAGVSGEKNGISLQIRMDTTNSARPVVVIDYVGWK